MDLLSTILYSRSATFLAGASGVNPLFSSRFGGFTDYGRFANIQAKAGDERLQIIEMRAGRTMVIIQGNAGG